MASIIEKPPAFSFASLTENNLGTVKKLNSVLFPVKYSEKFYKDILDSSVEDYCKLAYYNDIPVGIICCRLESKEDSASLYIMTMGILAPYRSRGLGSKCLEILLEAAAKHHKPKIDKLSLHVQVSNDRAKAFYEKHGFVEGELCNSYYKKITPSAAWKLERRITVKDEGTEVIEEGIAVKEDEGKATTP